MGTLKPQSSGPLYSNTVGLIGTLAVDEWAVTFGTVTRCMGGVGAQSSRRCARCNSPTVDSQSTNFILFDVALLLPLQWRSGLRGTSQPGRRTAVAT